MFVRVGKRKYSVYAFDIESHNDSKSIKQQKTSMWLGCLINEKSQVYEARNYFYNMNQFIDILEDLSNPKRKTSKENKPCKNVLIYVYNLSFEWSFLLPVLLQRGYEFSEVIDKNSEFVFNTVSTKSVSSVWMINLKCKKSGGFIRFVDLAKIYGGGLANVAKAFNLPTQKGSINYRKYRRCKNKEYHIKAKEYQYIFEDCKIIMDILQQVQNSGDKDFFNVVSMASYSMKKMIKEGYQYHKKPFRAYRNEYPCLNQEETKFLRESVSGGITYVPYRWHYKEINQKVLHIDSRQMHPSQMATKDFPYGEGEYGLGAPTKFFKRINCCRIKVSYSSVKLHSIIQLIGIECISNWELVVWDFEIPTMKKCYNNLEIDYIDHYCYKTKKLPFRKYIQDNYYKRLEAKKSGDNYNVLRFKLLNNSSYGKFLEKPHNQIYQNYINGLGFIDSIVTDKDELSQEISAKYTYLPVGSCIPAYSRVQLVETALLFDWKKVCYFDTDSIFVLWDEDTEKVLHDQIDLSNKMGAWAIEEICERAQFTAPKRYKTEIVDEQGNPIANIKAGGINFNEYIKNKASSLHIPLSEVIIPFDEVNIVASSWKVQRAFRCEGGTLIDFQVKEMNVPKKYQMIYRINTKEAS